MLGTEAIADLLGMAFNPSGTQSLPPTHESEDVENGVRL
jgi:hypothetical protein